MLEKTAFPICVNKFRNENDKLSGNFSGVIRPPCRRTISLAAAYALAPLLATQSYGYVSCEIRVRGAHAVQPWCGDDAKPSGAPDRPICPRGSPNLPRNSRQGRLQCQGQARSHHIQFFDNAFLQYQVHLQQPFGCYCEIFSMFSGVRKKLSTAP